MGSEQLPHLQLEEQPTKRSKKAMFMIAVFSFLLLSLPVSLYLVQNQQQISSRAALEEKVIFEDSISLSTPTETVGINQNIPVDIIIRSDSNSVNLAQIKLQFNPSLVKVSEIVTNPAQTANKVFFGKYWLSKGYDNDKGEINLISGTPTPGIKTEPGGATFLLAQIRFVTLSEGETAISLSPETSLLTNSGSTPSTISQKNINLNIRRDAALPNSANTGFTGKVQTKYSEMQPSSEIKNQVNLISPVAGEVFFYFRPIDIKWNASGESIKSLTLFLNGEPFGIIAENIPNTGVFTWTPSLSIPLPMVIPENTYSLQLTTILKDGQSSSSEVSSPFGLISNPNGKTVAGGAVSLKETSGLTKEDASRMLEKWGSEVSAENTLDLNGDTVVNYLDWYLLRKALFVKDQVY